MLRATSRISKLIKKAQELGQTALALTDHGNMFGMLEFFTGAKKAGLKPIIGCDLYVAPDSCRNTNYAVGERAWHQVVVLAENDTGYKNTAQNIYRSFKLRSQTVEEQFGDATSNPAILGQLLIDSRTKNSAVYDDILKDLRLLPSRASFRMQIEHWAATALNELAVGS